MAKTLKLNAIEIAGIKQLCQQGKSVVEIQEEMPKNKANLVIAACEEFELSKEVVGGWDEAFQSVHAKMKAAGVQEDLINRIIAKTKEDLDLETLDPDPTALYIECIKRAQGGSLTKNMTEGGKSGVHSMNQAAATPQLYTTPQAQTVNRNIFRPNN